MRYISPTYGVFDNSEQVVRHMIKRIMKRPSSEWTIAIGTDSQNHGPSTRMCATILLLEKGKGGIYFYSVNSIPRIKVIQQRMLKEAEISISVGHKIIDIMEDLYLSDEVSTLYDYNLNLEIHCDLGTNGKSKDAIKAAIGWITAEFGDKVTTKIKPDSPAASYVADKHTK